MARSFSDPALGRSVPDPWDGFVAGPENELAHASVLALARGKTAGISPLVIHGPSGVGKSRLLEGLVAELLLRRPGASLAHLTAESFVAACAEAAVQPGGWGILRERFRALDLFVLEDLHGLERAPFVFEELAHTLDALDNFGGGVAVSARSAPSQWLGWPRRLVSRLSGGLSVPVGAPSLASRRRYLLDQARVRSVSLRADAVDTLADAADGYRTLDGWLASLAVLTRLNRRPIDANQAASLVLEDAAQRVPTIDEVARAVAAWYGVPLRDLRSSSRRRAAAEPRHLAMHLARVWTGRSLQAVGTYFGGRDPATVRHACKQAANRLAADSALALAASALGRPWRRELINDR